MGTVAKSQNEQRITATAPRIKVDVVASAGTDREQHWTLIKPVTVIGSRRHAQIIVREEQVERSHALIVNTGADVLLVDLASETGTYCNGRLVSMHPLTNGDVVRVGSLEMHVVIELPPNPVVPRRGILTFDDPLKMPKAMRLVDVDTDHQWDITDSVAIIGSCKQAHIRLQSEEIARVHSVIFATIHGIGIVDLGSSTRLKVNGTEKRTVYLKEQDRLLIGKSGLMVQFPGEGRAVQPDHLSRDPQEVEMELTQASLTSLIGPGESDAEPGTELASLGTKITALQEELAQSWGQIHEWKKKLTVQYNNLTVREQDLVNKEKHLRLLAGELEGQAEQLADQEKGFQQQQVDLSARQADLEQTKTELEARNDDLKSNHAELMTLAVDLDGKRKEVERFAAEYATQRQDIENQRQALESQQCGIVEEQAGLARERESVGALTGELEDKARRLDDRETKLAAREGKIQARQQAIEESKQKLDAREQQLSASRGELSDYEHKLQTRYDELVHKEEQSHARGEIILRFKQFLEEANEAYDITVNTPVESTAHALPKAPVAKKTPADEPVSGAVSAVSHVQRARHSAVGELADETRQMVEELPSDGGEVCPSPGESADDDTAAADAQAAAPGDAIDWNTIEPEVRKRFRALKRIGGNGKSDADLITQLQAELHGQQAKTTKGRKKKAWWKT